MVCVKDFRDEREERQERIARRRRAREARKERSATKSRNLSQEARQDKKAVKGVPGVKESQGSKNPRKIRGRGKSDVQNNSGAHFTDTTTNSSPKRGRKRPTVSSQEQDFRLEALEASRRERASRFSERQKKYGRPRADENILGSQRGQRRASDTNSSKISRRNKTQVRNEDSRRRVSGKAKQSGQFEHLPRTERVKRQRGEKNRALRDKNSYGGERVRLTAQERARLREEEEKKRVRQEELNKRYLKILLALIVIVALILVGYYVLSRLSEQAKERSEKEETYFDVKECSQKYIHPEIIVKSKRAQGHPVNFDVTLKNISGTNPCSIDVGKKNLHLKVKTGDDVVFESAKCDAIPDSKILLIDRDMTAKVPVTWGGYLTGCGTTGDAAKSGTYVAELEFADNPSVKATESFPLY